MNQFHLDPSIIETCRQDAFLIADEVLSMVEQHSTVSVERSVLRLIGVDGVNDLLEPLPNMMVDEVYHHGDLSKGISRYLASALFQSGLNLTEFQQAYLKGQVQLITPHLEDLDTCRNVLKPYLQKTFDRIAKNRDTRHRFLEKETPRTTDLYVIVATGNIHEDVIQAKAAAKAGADIIAVIRSTGQSLLDYVPYGITTEGFGGTYATQANFQIMRKALDEVSKEEGRYIKLVNYASGLCMPEIAAMAAIERLDVLLNDSMYGIIFRDINMKRTFIDQHFSRMINAKAGIIINTGEDNYLTTSDAIEEAHTVLASQFINEQFAFAAGLPEELMGLGHAFEIDPSVENSFLYELAQAQMAREIFPNAPLKYMPPTKHVTGNIFRAYQQNTLFNIVTQYTSQSIHLLGMMTEAIHTPFLQDRYLAIQNAKMIQTSMKSISEELVIKEDGLMANRAKKVLEDASLLLKQVKESTLFQALEQGVFAGVKRPQDGGKGLDGVFQKSPDYWNAALDLWEVSR
ncbi:MAG: lysine 5,6-aminomutase subunit alpha [Candidatus Izemoplasmatales bacterium]|nr:lysine 5,6-aminomutase subunit alpha [Candidatus Izemoplasmatales bacterium]